MRTEDLLDVMNDVDDELLQRSEKKKVKNVIVWKRWLPLAACACLILVVGVVGMSGAFSRKMSADSKDMNDCETALPESETEKVEGEAPFEGISGNVMGSTDGEAEIEMGEPASEETEFSYNGVNPFSEAEKTGSAFVFYKYDGKKIAVNMIFDSSTKAEILNSVAAAEFSVVDDWTTEAIDGVVYGLETGGEDGRPIRVAWHDNYWIQEDGSVVYADLDVTSLETDYEWEYKDTYDSMTAFPSARWLCQTEDGWDTRYMTEADKPYGSDKVEMTIYEQSEDFLRVTIENNKNSVWEYGESYAIDVLVDDTWYQVPAEEVWDVVAIAYTLPAKESVDIAYNLERFQPLPEGIYRLVVEGVAAEFEIK